MRRGDPTHDTIKGKNKKRESEKDQDELHENE
jgi:hypothetical protein